MLLKYYHFNIQRKYKQYFQQSKQLKNFAYYYNHIIYQLIFLETRTSYLMSVSVQYGIIRYRNYRYYFFLSQLGSFRFDNNL